MTWRTPLCEHRYQGPCKAGISTAKAPRRFKRPRPSSERLLLATTFQQGCSRSQDCRPSPGIEVDDPLAIAEQVEVWISWAGRTCSARPLRPHQATAGLMRCTTQRSGPKVRHVRSSASTIVEVHGPPIHDSLLSCHASSPGLPPPATAEPLPRARDCFSVPAAAHTVTSICNALGPRSNEPEIVYS